MAFEPDVAEWFGGAQRILFVHAHPDDESIFTGGTLAALAHTGRDVSLLTLTRGERGEVLPSELKRLEGTPQLAGHRSRELQRALQQLGVRRFAFLGTELARASGKPQRRYRDSGMQWGPDGRAEAAATVDPDALACAELDEVRDDVIAFVRATGAEVLVSYDEDGGYGHPDHVVAHRAALAAATALNLALWVIVAESPAPLASPASHAGALPVHEHVVDRWFDRKRGALAQHASQLTIEGSALRLSGGQVHEISLRECFTLKRQ